MKEVDIKICGINDIRSGLEDCRFLKRLVYDNLDCFNFIKEWIIDDILGSGKYKIKDIDRVELELCEFSHLILIDLLNTIFKPNRFFMLEENVYVIEKTLFYVKVCERVLFYECVGVNREMYKRIMEIVILAMRYHKILKKTSIVGSSKFIKINGEVLMEGRFKGKFTGEIIGKVDGKVDGFVARKRYVGEQYNGELHEKCSFNGELIGVGEGILDGDMCGKIKEFVTMVFYSVELKKHTIWGIDDMYNIVESPFNIKKVGGKFIAISTSFNFNAIHRIKPELSLNFGEWRGLKKSLKTPIYVDNLFKEEIKKLFRESMVLSISKMDRESIYKFKNMYKNMDDPYFNDLFMDDNNNTNTRDFIKKNHQKFINLLIVNEILNKFSGNPMFFPYSIDMRNRIYLMVTHGITFFKPSRQVLVLKNGVLGDVLKSKFWKYLKKHIESLKKHIDITNYSEFDLYFIIVITISMGCYNKNKILEEKKRCYIYINEFIHEGFLLHKKKPCFLELDEDIQFIKLSFILSLILNKKEYKLYLNTMVYKDATASGFMNSGIFYGYKKESLKYINLSNEEVWYDTYTFLMEKGLNLSEYNKVNKRSIWKPTIMTAVYNSQMIESRRKIIKLIELKEGIYLSNDKNFHKIHDDFHKFLKKESLEFLFKTSNYQPKKYGFYKNYNLIYKSKTIIKKQEYKTSYKKLVDKHYRYEFSHEIDKKKTTRAYTPNITHIEDALLVIHIQSKMDVLPIHDSFGVRLMDLHILYDEVNFYYRQHHKQQQYSTTILI